MLFSGGKDSVVMLHLAAKAFWPAPIPFGLLHVDTGHNFPEVLEYRDQAAAFYGAALTVARVQDYIDDGRLRERPDGPRNPLQTVPLLDAITDGKHDAVFGGGRRDEERARAKERVFSMRDEFGQWDPRNQRPELWSLYNGRHLPGEHVRVFPLSNWTELDVWDYIEAEKIALPSIYYAHEREVMLRDGMWIAITPVTPAADGERGRAALGALPHRRRHVLHRRRAVRRHHRARRDHRGRPELAHRARRHPGRRPAVRGRDGGPQAGGLLLMPTRSAPPSAAGGRTLLRLATAGSVDDGKSTLVGRLLFDTNSVLTDTLDHVEQVSQRRGLDRADLALLTDGLRAEREQGITIDVAYRYFATPARKFILADCPGHVQYTRNTVTGSSTADVIVLLVDARNGVVEQTRRHLAVASLLRVPHVVLVVNKIDLVDYAEDVFWSSRHRLRPAGPQPRRARHPLHPGLGDRGRQRGDPLDPDAVVRRADRARLPGDRRRPPAGPGSEFRFPVQHVVRPQSAAPAPWAARAPEGGRRLPRLRRQDRVRPGPGRRGGRGAAARLARRGGGDRHPGRPAGGRRRRPVGGAPAGPGHRRLPRRHPGRHRRPAGAGPRHHRDRLLAGRARAARSAPGCWSSTGPRSPRPSSRRSRARSTWTSRPARCPGWVPTSTLRLNDIGRVRLALAIAAADRRVQRAPDHRRLHPRRRGRRLDARCRHGRNHADCPPSPPTPESTARPEREPS